MKYTSRNIIYSLLFLFAFSNCQEMDSTFEEFIVPGGITYPGKAASAVVYNGKNRVQVSWPKIADPNVVKARIYWNNYADSVEVEVLESLDTVRVNIADLDEGAYSFIIKTFDAQGNSSVPVEVLGAVYGDLYQSSLHNRPVRQSILEEFGEITIQWGVADIANGASGMEVKFTDESGKEQVRRFSVNQSASALTNVKPGARYQYRTIYVPDTLSIDTFYTDYMENKRLLLNKSKWTIANSSGNHPGAANLVGNVIDGDPATRWHTHANKSNYPHHAVVDMGAEYTVTDFEIYRMFNDDRGCDTFQLLVSQDNITWTDLGVFDFNRLTDEGQFYNVDTEPKARYFKFVGLSGPHNYMVTGEINVYVR